MTIRSALPADEAAIVELWYQCGLVAHYNDPIADLRNARDGPTSDVLVGWDVDGLIIGTVMVGYDGHRGWLYYVAARPARRGEGVGRAMVEAGERWLRARSVAKVQLMVRPTNETVVGFYDRLGYEDMPRVLMGKWLRD